MIFKLSFYDSNTVDHVINKIDKFYQSDDRYLVIVLYGPIDQATLAKIEKEIMKQEKVPNKKHISLMTMDQYTKFLKMEEGVIKEGIADKNALVHMVNIQTQVEQALASYDSLEEFDKYCDNFVYDKKAQLLQPKITKWFGNAP